MLGQYIRSTDRQLLAKKTHSYSCWGEIWKETESEIIAAQGQALLAKYHATKILQTETHC
jgi:hypothetical protein